ncbi:MAG: zinc ribbon domain-containing protein [Zetaproteobacteria bacterium CG_4_9_14_3_um_filter_53_7]|nr:MAG: zinc ribbon domain-containing protein [Zetaproteobacteria bacterium CG_4_9_14_3_um_filter_53_7]
MMLLLAALLGIIPAVIAQKKGRNALLWWVFGTLLFIVALPVSLLIKPLPPQEAGKKCPKCAEYIKQEALICKHCGSDVSSIGNSPIEATVIEDRSTNEKV